MVTNKIKHILSVFFALLVVSCSKDYNGSILNRQQEIKLSAIIEGHTTETKTSLESNSVVWNNNDEISVLSNGKNEWFILSAGALTPNGVFSGTELSVAEKYYALYPWSSNASYDGTNIFFDLPETQHYLHNSFGNGSNPAIATFTNPEDNLQFKNICGVLSLYLKGSGNLSKIELTGKDNEYLWGNFILSANQYVGTSNQTMSYSSNGGKTVILDCGIGVNLSSIPKEFNIVIPAHSFSKGFDATCYFKDDTSSPIIINLSSSENQTINRSEKHVMAVQNVNIPVNLENDQVKAYLDYVEDHPYIDGDYSYTYITNYYGKSTSYRKDRPSPVNIEWVRNSSSTAQYLTVSSNSDFSNAYYNNFELSNTSSTYDIYDLIPGKKYYYKVTADVSGETQTLVSEEVFTTGRRRMLNIDNTFNVRDLGGIRTADGHTIKFEKIFRGGRPNEESGSVRITSVGKQAMKRAGIKAELDLRTDAESANLTECPFNIPPDYIVDYTRFPESNSGIYTKINTNYGKVNIQELQWVIDELKAEKPVYFHCAVGADRTGTLAALIEGLLGVDENQLSIDYELTSFSEAGLRQRGPRSSSSRATNNLYSIYSEIMKVPDALSPPVDYPASVTTPFQKRFYNYFYRGIDGKSISKADLDWFINYMLE